MNINDMPDLVILAIFDRLPLDDFLQLNQICFRWQLLQAKAGVVRHHVTLLLGEEPLSLLDELNHFTIPYLEDVIEDDGTQASVSQSVIAKSQLCRVECTWLDQNAVQWLAKVMPNVTSLNVVQNRISSAVIEQVIYLLHRWSAKLITLRVWGSFQEDLSYNEERLFIASNVFGLLQEINFMNSLQHLMLQFTLDIAATSHQRIDLPILAQLHEFYFYSINDTADVIYGSLSRHASANDQLQQIGLANSVHSSDCLNRFLRLTPQLAARFTHLSVAYENRDASITAGQLGRLGTHFTSLTSLTLDIGASSLSQIANSLSQLAQLMHLDLSVDFSTNCIAFSEDDHTPSSAIGRLCSVRVLTLLASLTSHDNMNSRHLAWIFPRLQVLRPRCCIRKCLGCQNGPPGSASQCLQLAIQPWRQCGQLRKIVNE